MSNLDFFVKELEPFVPKNSVAYLGNLVKDNPFHLKISAPRKTKKGDFRPTLRGGLHHISVNGDLNSYEFLVTLIHEYAHLITWNQFQRKVKPHGEEWRQNFEKFMLPLLNESIFPSSLLATLKKHMKRPSASSCVDLELQRAMSKYDLKAHQVKVEDLEIGSLFIYGKNRQFKLIKKRRTRYLCESIQDQKSYSFSALTPVDPIVNN